jgi:hypothetical protein
VGEEIADLDQISAVVDEYLQLLGHANNGDFGADLQIGFDLSNVGLLVSRDLALSNTARISTEAAKQGVSVVISMERSAFTDQILNLFSELAPDHYNLGITVQAQLNRTSHDLDMLLTLGRKIRLVKGVYNQHSSISLRRGNELDERYLSFAKRLSEGQATFAVATHDAVLVQKLKDYGIFDGDGELESLHGCNPSLLRSEPLPADAGSIVAVLRKVLKYDVVRDVAAGRTEIPSGPEVPPPVAPFELRELLLQAARRPPFDASHDVGDGVLGRHGQEHVHMVPRKHAFDDRHAQLVATLSDDFPCPFADVAGQHLVTIFCSPNNVIPMVVHAVSPEVISGHPYPLENETLTRSAGFHFPGGKDVVLDSR